MSSQSQYLSEPVQMTSSESQTATRARRLETLALAGILACFFGLLTYVNCFWSCYPNDNDLDEVGWLAAHLSFARPESFANQGYPPGQIVVLRLLWPLVGSFLRAAFLWQAVAATASVFFVFRITRELCSHRAAGVLALASAALAGLPVFTSEFADGTSTALFLGGFWALTRRAGDQRGFFLFGLAAGAAYLFRTHYLISFALVPASLVVAGFGLRGTGRAWLAFASGFAATAWPLWLLNTLAYGTPVHAGVSQYNIALAVVPGAFSWEDYPNTYNQWPVSRILQERPLDFYNNVVEQARQTFGIDLLVAGAGAGAFAMALVPERHRRQLLAFGGLLALLYVLAVIVPTRYTDRAFAPVAMLACVLLACGLGELVRLTGKPVWFTLWATLAVVYLIYPTGLWDRLAHRARDARYNTRLTKLLVANGMQSSGEVFSNDWNIYNMADPQFISFYNYGGWIELDSLYARERPHPTAQTPAEWQEFFAAHGIRFAILKQRPDTRELIRNPPPTWRRLQADKRFTVWALGPAPELKEVAATGR